MSDSGLLRDLGQDVRYAFRLITRHPAFSVAAIAMLALTIGANTAIFSLVYAVALRPLPYAHPDQLVALTEVATANGQTRSIAYQNFEDWRAQSHSFTQLAGYVGASYNVTNAAGEPERVLGVRVTPNFLQTLGLVPARGRDFIPEDGVGDGTHVVLVTDALWKRRFDADAGVVGKVLSINFAPYTVVGVLPPSFRFLPDTELLMPLGTNNGDRGSHNGMFAIGRLAPGVTIESARNGLQTVAQRLATTYPGTNSGLGVGVLSLQESWSEGRRTLAFILLFAVLLLLCIGSANLANLFVARGLARQRETQIRAALGASRWRVLRQILIESLLLAHLGAALGVLLAWLALPALTPLVPASLRAVGAVEINRTILGYTILLAIVASVLFGLLPAFLDLLRHGQVLTEGNVRGTSGTPLSRHMRALLLLSEVALAVMLLIGAGLVVKSLYRLQRVDTGFVADNVLRMRVSFPAAKARDPERVIQFFQQTVSAVEQLNGVRAAGAVLCPPLGGGCWEAVFGVEGQTAITRAQVPSARFNSVAGNYFGAIGTRLLKGRTFTDTDYQQRRPLVVVNKSLANRFWGNVDPIGRRIKIGWPPTGPNPWLEVVGVVDDSKRDTLAEPGQMEAFVMHPTAPRPFLDLIVRTDVPPMSLARTVRDTVWRFDKDAMLFNVGTMEDSLSKSLTPQRFPALLVSLFAGLALLLATAGIYSVVAFAVTQQLGEIAIRLALGAGRQQLLFAVGRQALFAIGIGVVVGLGGAWGFSRMLSGLLFEVPVVDSVTFIFVPLLVLAVALVATFVPALRALRVDAAAVLRTL